MSNGVAPEGSNFSAIEAACMFYKLIVPSIIQDKKLRLPVKFVKKYGKELSSIATLTGPNGRIWVVELEKVESKLWFHNGWLEFVDHYSIRIGHFLVFKYGGDSNFQVHVYDLTVCELSYPCNSSASSEKPSQDNQNQLVCVKEEVDDDGMMEMLGSCSENCQDDGEKLLEEAKFEPSGTVIMTRGRKRRTGLNQCERRSRKKFDNSSIGITPETCTRRWRSVTKEEKDNAIRVADMYKPENPFFRVILRPSYVYRGFLLHIPNSFAQKYLMSASEFITLEASGGKRWSVRCVCGDGKAKLCKGWTEFVWGNKLEEGDVCVFELIDKKDITMKVTVFRVLEDEAAANT